METLEPTTLHKAVTELERVMEQEGACVARVILSDAEGNPQLGILVVHGPDAQEVWAHMDALEAEWTKRNAKRAAEEAQEEEAAPHPGE